VAAVAFAPVKGPRLSLGGQAAAGIGHADFGKVPKGYEPDAEIMRWASVNGEFTCTDNVFEAAKDADVLYTDVWASMGQEGEAAERKKIFAGYQINSDVMAVAHSDAMVLHCLPAHRGEEITDEIIEAHAAEIFDEAENRLHAQKAVLVKCLA